MGWGGNNIGEWTCKCLNKEVKSKIAISLSIYRSLYRRRSKIRCVLKRVQRWLIKHDAIRTNEGKEATLYVSFFSFSLSLSLFLSHSFTILQFLVLSFFFSFYMFHLLSSISQLSRLKAILPPCSLLYQSRSLFSISFSPSFFASTKWTPRLFYPTIFEAVLISVYVFVYMCLFSPTTFFLLLLHLHHHHHHHLLLLHLPFLLNLFFSLLLPRQFCIQVKRVSSQLTPGESRRLRFES